MVPLFEILGPSLVPLFGKSGPYFVPSYGLFGRGTGLLDFFPFFLLFYYVAWVTELLGIEPSTDT